MVNMAKPLHYAKQIHYMLEKLDIEGPRNLEPKRKEFSAEIMNSELQRNVTTCFAILRVTATLPTKKSPFFRSDKTARIYHELICMNMELGNRKKCDDYAERFLVCPLCNDEQACFNEIHMLFVCEKLEYARYQTGIRGYMDNITDGYCGCS